MVIILRYTLCVCVCVCVHMHVCMGSSCNLVQIFVDLNACKTQVEKKKVIHTCSKIKTLPGFSVRENHIF
jgi:hypothetical protein